MLARLSLILATIALGVGQHAGASPITFDFTGTLPVPLNGVSQFSGSFTINGDPTAFKSDPGAFTGTGVFENGSDVSLTVKMGGQVYNFTNQQGPYTTASFAAGQAYSWNSYQSPQDEASIYGGTSSVNGSPGVSFAMSFYSDAASDQLGNLRDFSFPLGSSSVYVVTTSSYPLGGTISSIELVPTPAPEPSTLAIFALLGIAAMARRSLVGWVVTLSLPTTCVHWLGGCPAI